MSEQELQQRIRLELSNGPVRLWRNNVGALRDQRGRLVSYGLCRGSSDLIGLRQLRIRPDQVGSTVAVFCAIEVKTAQGQPSAAQRQFLALVHQMGGIAAVVRSLSQARSLLQLPE